MALWVKPWPNSLRFFDFFRDSAFVEMIEKGLVVACQMCECSEMLFSNEIERLTM
jgi:hypothetical protein